MLHVDARLLPGGITPEGSMVQKCGEVNMYSILSLTGEFLQWFSHVSVCNQLLLNLNISGWWFQPLSKILVTWDEYNQYMGK